MTDWQTIVERFNNGELSGDELRQASSEIELTAEQRKELTMMTALTNMLPKVCDLPLEPDGALDRLRQRIPDDVHLISLDDGAEVAKDSSAGDGADVIGKIGPASMSGELPDVMAAGKEFHKDDDANDDASDDEGNASDKK